MKPKILILFLALGSFKVFSQGIVYYPFNSVIGLNTNPKAAIWLDVRLQTNSYFSSLSTEISPEFTIKKKPRALYYIGAGVKINYLNAVQDNQLLEGAFLNAGARLSPFDKYKGVQIVFDISPFVSQKADIGIFRSSLGIGYNFGK